MRGHPKVSEHCFDIALLLGTFSLFLALISRTSIVDPDLFHEMSLFRESLQLGRLPEHDLYSYIPTVFPVVHHEWGTGALVYLLTVKLGSGAQGLMILKGFLTLFIVINVYRFALQQGGERIIFVYCALFGVLMGWIGFTTIRAQLLTLFLLLVLLYIIERDRRGDRRALWFLVPLFVSWVNLHGGFVVGMGMVALYVMECSVSGLSDNGFIRSLRRVQKQLLVVLLCCIGLLLNPYGVDYFPYLWQAITLDRTDLIMEWQPVWASSPLVLTIYCGAVLLVIYPLVVKGLRELPGLSMVLVAMFAGLLHIRHLSIFALLFLCYVPGYLRGTPVGKGIQRVFANNRELLCFLYGAISVIFIVFSVSHRFWELKVPTDRIFHERGAPVYPVGAVDYLNRYEFKGNLMTPFQVGAYVSWRAYPEIKVSMDSRFEVAYPYQALLSSVSFYNGASGWYRASMSYDTDALLVPNWAKVKRFLDEDPGVWRLVYKDGAYSLYMLEGIAPAYPVVDLGFDTVAGSFP